MKFIRRFCSRRFSPDPHQLPAAGVFTPISIFEKLSCPYMASSVSLLCQTATIIIWQEGQSNKHARRRPFSAVRASLTLTVDGLASSRGALQDPHQERARNMKNPAAVGRRRPAAHRPPRERAKRQRTRRDTPSKGHSYSIHAKPLSFRQKP